MQNGTMQKKKTIEVWTKEHKHRCWQEPVVEPWVSSEFLDGKARKRNKPIYVVLTLWWNEASRFVCREKASILIQRLLCGKHIPCLISFTPLSNSVEWVLVSRFRDKKKRFIEIKCLVHGLSYRKWWSQDLSSDLVPGSKLMFIHHLPELKIMCK